MSFLHYTPAFNTCNIMEAWDYHVKRKTNIRSVFQNMAMKCLICLFLTKKKTLQSNNSTLDSNYLYTVCYQRLQKSDNGANFNMLRSSAVWGGGCYIIMLTGSQSIREGVGAINTVSVVFPTI